MPKCSIEIDFPPTILLIRHLDGEHIAVLHGHSEQLVAGKGLEADEHPRARLDYVVVGNDSDGRLGVAPSLGRAGIGLVSRLSLDLRLGSCGLVQLVHIGSRKAQTISVACARVDHVCTVINALQPSSPVRLFYRIRGADYARHAELVFELLERNVTLGMGDAHQTVIRERDIHNLVVKLLNLVDLGIGIVGNHANHRQQLPQAHGRAARDAIGVGLPVHVIVEINPLTKHKNNPYIRQRNPWFICDSAQIAALF